MTIFAGTSKGLFRFEPAGARSVLAEPQVRELQRLQGVLWAGTANGLFRSIDDGQHWDPAGLQGLAVWQIRGEATGPTLYAGVEPAAFYRSTDGGHTWTELPSLAAHPEAHRWCVPVQPRLPPRARAVAVDPDNPRRLWVGVEVGGMLRSDDAGEHWTLTLPGENPDIHMLCVHPADPRTLFVSTGYGRFDGVAEMIEGNAGVFRSDDAGATWRYAWQGVTPRYSRPMCIDPRAPHALTVASAPTAFSSHRDEGGAQAALYRSDDGGVSWHSLGDAAHSPSPANFHGLAPDPDTPGGVLVGTDTGEVWRVSPQCRWTRVADGLPTVQSVIGV